MAAAPRRLRVVGSHHGGTPVSAATDAPVVTGHSATRRTLLTLLACALGVTPLKSLLADTRWLGEAWLTMAIVILPAALLRLRRAPNALDIWPGIILLVPWLTHVYVPHHAWGGFLPTRHTFGDIADLMDSLHRTTTDEIAPIHSTVAVRLVICALLGLLAALMDLIAVVGRRGALAGVPLLVVYTVSGAVPRTPVAWFWFCVAAAGYLILLSLDAADELRDWGRQVSRPGAARSRPGLAFSAQRIGIVAILVAVFVPLLVPDHPRNLIADAFHTGGGKGLGGFGAGSGGGSISPFAALKGQLDRDKPVNLMRVRVDSNGSVQPFYVRSNVLDKFTGDGWTVSEHGDTEPVDVSTFGTLPLTSEPRTLSYQAEITVTGLTGNPPVFSIPRAIQGLDSEAEWSQQDQVVLGDDVARGDQFTEVVAQPEPTIQDLGAAPAVTGEDMSRWLELPSLPTYVTDLVTRLTAGKSTPYQRARAISDWFADPSTGFVYSLKTTKGDSGSDLVDFLQHRTGFCQQFAAAMGVMLRDAGVPTRLVLGYMHPAPDTGGTFSVTTFDAHSWVEAFFPGSGWIPFDPTPTAGLTGGRKTDLSWAPHVFSSNVIEGPSRSNTGSRGLGPTSSPGGVSAAPSATSSGSSSDAPAVWAGIAIGVLILLGLAPAGVRTWRRRSRLAAARRGDPDALWAELSDTAVDLGYVWSPARTPRQVSAWLAPDAADTAPALSALAVAVEHRRYSPDPEPADAAELTRGLLDVTDQLWSRRSGKVRLQARLWPASLGWGRRLGAARSVLRRRH
jgi:transglutaminase-like putative cysteine protease